jgi:ribosomal protein S18 acetylase RimI-like enzyme
VLNNYVFRLAENDDIFGVVTIYHSLVGTPGCTWDFEYPSEETATHDIKNKALYVLAKDNEIIAVATATDKYNELEHLQWTIQKPCELYRIGVSPKFLKQGIGSILLKNIITAMQEKGFDGIRQIVSKTNPAALALYDKNGFERCGETFLFEHEWYCYQIVF